MYAWDQSSYGKLAPQGKSDIEGLATRIGLTMENFVKNAAKDKLTVGDQFLFPKIVIYCKLY